MPVYGFSNIIDINREGLVYADENGDRQFIDFNECSKNWVKQVNESNDNVTGDGAPHRNISERTTTCVGKRDWFADKPYF